LLADTSIRPPTQIWDTALGRLQLQVPKPSFETWLRGTTGISYTNGEFTVEAPNAFVAEMLDQRMYSLICDSITMVVGERVSVKFEVAKEEAPPSIDPRSSTSTRKAHSPVVQPSLTSHQLGTLNPAFTFGTFVRGSSNELAHAAAQASAENPGASFNPIFIHSEVGLGKTHLLHAIGHEMASIGLSFIYATTEQFTNEYIRAIRSNSAETFRKRYRGADALLLDDIQFIIGKESTQEGFFHTFNALHMSGKQIVVTSDRPLSELSLLQSRVSSRLSGGLVVDIQPPDIETRIAILQNKSHRHHLPAEVIEYIAQMSHRNVRALEGCLNRVVAISKLSRERLNIEYLKGALSDIMPDTYSKRVTDEAVVNAVVSHFGLSPSELESSKRDKRTTRARHICMYLLREDTGMALATIGRLLGGRDHSTVVSGHQRIVDRINTEDDLRRDIVTIRGALAAP